MMVKSIRASVAVLSVVFSFQLAQAFQISGLDKNGILSWTGGYPIGVCTLESALLPQGPWHPEKNVYTHETFGQILANPGEANRFFRLLTVDISANAADAFSNLVSAYGTIETIAGIATQGTDGVNYWQSSFEGGAAASAALSRPHFAMADAVGNILIVDKDSHSLLKVTPDGRIHTAAGTHQAGNGPDSLAIATTVSMDSPNGLWVRPDGVAYILDTGNGKLRRLAADGTMTTLFHVKNGIEGGRGLWVKDDESMAYFVNGQDVIRWTPSGGFDTMNNKSFVDPGNLVVDPNSAIVVTDRGANRVYRINHDGSRDPIAGDGSTDPVIDGTPVLKSGLAGVSGIWFLPNGGYLLATHEGSQILYVDAAGIVHVFVNGSKGSHGGDGGWFYGADPKISEARSVTLDNEGNILIVENDAGFIRRIKFQRLSP
jgi:hypothetical protein